MPHVELRLLHIDNSKIMASNLELFLTPEQLCGKSCVTLCMLLEKTQDHGGINFGGPVIPSLFKRI